MKQIEIGVFKPHTIKVNNKTWYLIDLWAKDFDTLLGNIDSANYVEFIDDADNRRVREFMINEKVFTILALRCKISYYDNLVYSQNFYELVMNHLMQFYV